MRKSPMRTRFMRMVRVRQEDDCWEWIGARDSDGYGIFQVDRHSYRSHVLSYIIFNTRDKLRWPASEVIGAPMILHHCDRPWCVNPDHLYPGDAAQNMRDALERGQVVGGAEHRRKLEKNNPGLFKISESSAMEIRRRASRGELQKALAEEFGISRAQVCRIVSGKRWMS